MKKDAWYLRPILWASKTIENEFGNPDHIRATGFLFSLLISYTVVYFNFDSWYKIAVLCILVVGLMVLYKLVSASDIIEFKNGLEITKKEKTTEIEKVEKTIETTETKTLE